MEELKMRFGPIKLGGGKDKGKKEVREKKNPERWWN